jgi:hypothetical protein
VHTFKGDKGAIFNYNSDFSGDVFIKDVNNNDVKVEGSDILEFVAFCYVQSKKIERLEQADCEELLTGDKRIIDKGK